MCIAFRYRREKLGSPLFANSSRFVSEFDVYLNISHDVFHSFISVLLSVRAMVLNATFNNISAISWRSV